MYQADIKHTKDFVFSVSTNAGTISVDAKGKEGITPPDLLLASIGTCIGVYLRKYAEGSKIALDNVTIRVSAEFYKEPPLAFRHITAAIKLAGARLDERRQKALLEFIKNCPVHNTLKGNPDIAIILE